MAAIVRVSILHDVQLWRGKSNSDRVLTHPSPLLPTLLPSATVISIDGTIHLILPSLVNGSGEKEHPMAVAVSSIVSTILEKTTRTTDVNNATVVAADRVGVEVKIVVLLSVVGGNEDTAATSIAAYRWKEALQEQIILSHQPTASSSDAPITVHIAQINHLDDKGTSSSPKRKLLVCPGFMDSHVHFFDGGRRLNALSLGACKSKEAFISNIRRFLRERYILSGGGEGETSSSPLTADEGSLVLHNLAQPQPNRSSDKETTSAQIAWLAGNDWSDVKLGGQPSAAWIDEALTVSTSEKQQSYILPIPSVFYRIDCHSCVLSSEALRLCGIDQHGPTDPEGGTIVRDAQGRPTGMLREKAMALVRIKRKETMNFDDDALGQQYNAAASHLLKHGITSCFSMSSLEYDNIKEIEYLLRRPIPQSAAATLPVASYMCESTSTTSQDNSMSHSHIPEAPLVRIRSVVVPEEIPLLQKLRTEIKESSTNSGSRLSIASPCAFGSEFVSLGAVKVFADGALGSRTAAMEHPYGDLTGISSATSHPEDSDEHNIRHVVENASGRSRRYDCKARSAHQCPCGLLLTSVPELYSSIQRCSDAGFQCCVHGIGDRAVLMIQDAFEAASTSPSVAVSATSDETESSGLSTTPHIPRVLNEGELQSLQLRRNRIEHCQHVSSTQQLSRFARSHTIPSVQPCHLLFDGDHVEKRLGPHRARLSYPLMSMIQATTTTARDQPISPPPALCFGTDWMVTSIDPIANIQAAMLRQPIRFRTDASGGSDSKSLPVWAPEQRLTFEQCLAAYTTDAAYAAFWEGSIGRIEVGYKADFTILSLPIEIDGITTNDDENPFKELFEHRWEQPPSGNHMDIVRVVETLRVEAAICDSRLFPSWRDYHHRTE